MFIGKEAFIRINMAAEQKGQLKEISPKENKYFTLITAVFEIKSKTVMILKDRKVLANSVDPDQTAPGAVVCLPVHLHMSRDMKKPTK